MSTPARQKMGRDRRKWTAEEDQHLRGAVSQALHESRPLLWREIAKSVPDRTNKDCRRRWCNMFASDRAKGSWTESEDERLSEAVQTPGLKWSQVASIVGTRNSDQCSSHWSQTLDPGINYSDWTKEEDEKLLQGVQVHGTNWTQIASTHLPDRTRLSLKNRFSALRAKSRQLPDAPQTDTTTPQQPPSIVSYTSNSPCEPYLSSPTTSEPWNYDLNDSIGLYSPMAFEFSDHTFFDEPYSTHSATTPIKSEFPPIQPSLSPQTHTIPEPAPLVDNFNDFSANALVKRRSYNPPPEPITIPGHVNPLATLTQPSSSSDYISPTQETIFKLQPHQTQYQLPTPPDTRRQSPQVGSPIQHGLPHSEMEISIHRSSLSPSIPDFSSGVNTQHASIEVECTAEQLSTIMTRLVGQAKAVTVRMK